MNPVANLEEWRVLSAGKDNVVCVCGSMWFDLVAHIDGGAAGVTVMKDGSIAGYAGTLVCRECGTALDV